jgi:hypothetical protein
MACYMRALIREIALHPEMIWREPGRAILRGKIRRMIICFVPGLALHLKRRYRVTGGCISCGASCNLLLKCPHWDENSRLCSIYDDRPLTCRLFPITPADLRDRDLASGSTRCGYSLVLAEPPVTRTEPGTRLIALQQRSARRDAARQAPDSRPIVHSVDAVDERRRSADHP